jgi:tripartite-type tricarboxylate transporter receptor subunit TctC
MLHRSPEWIDKGLMDFHGIIEIPKGRKHSHPRLAQLPDVETLAKSDTDRKLVTIYRTFVGSGNPFILPPATPKEQVQVLQEAMRKTYKDPEFFKEYTKLSGLEAEPQTPEELEQTIKEMPRDPEVIELFKKIMGPDPLPQK